MLRAILVFLILGIVVVYFCWDQSDKTKRKQVFYSLFNKSLSGSKDKNKIYGVSVNIIEMIDELDLSPSTLHKILKDMERNNYVTFTNNVAKLTAEGVAYFKFKYLGQ